MKTNVFKVLFILFLTIGCSENKEIKTLTKDVKVPEFICLGNEPFWSLEIKQNSMMFSEAGYDTIICGKVFNADLKGDSIVYTASGDVNLSAVIIKADCSDTMSDNKYEYKSVVKVNGKKYNGCAKERSLPKIESPFEYNIKHTFSDKWTEDNLKLSFNSEDILNDIIYFKIESVDGKLLFKKQIKPDCFIKAAACIPVNEFDKIDSVKALLKGLSSFLSPNNFVKPAEYFIKDNETGDVKTSEWLFIFDSKIDGKTGLFYSKTQKNILEF
ncbi:MAG: hypothetical protein JEY94_11490 [Melioribacteraceae bacterium]|nr:hypothetical protein [Melioribacteraceae bacterium]